VRRLTFEVKPPSSKIRTPFLATGMAQMNVHPNLLDSFARRKARSALAYLLLLAIGYGAIVEAAHSHGFSTSSPSQLTAVSGDSDSQSSYQGHTAHNECSLCQFQRQLFGSLVQVILVAHAAPQFAFLTQETISYLSTLALPTLGRAPPLF
jgi:hypothetical protein